MIFLDLEYTGEIGEIMGYPIICLIEPVFCVFSTEMRKNLL
jgi:hypothetical protein